MITKRQLYQEIERLRTSLTDEQVFKSAAYTKYLEDIAQSCAQMFNRQVAVRAVWNDDPKSPDYITGQTEGRTIWVNPRNHLTWSLPSRAARNLCNIGLVGHELGHVLFSDFHLLNSSQISILTKGELIHVPSLTTEAERKNFAELKAALANDDATRSLIAAVTQDLLNILEDNYVEARISTEFPGTFAQGIAMRQVAKYKESPSIVEMIDKGMDGYLVLRNLLAQYCCGTGTYNNRGYYYGPLLDDFHAGLAFVDATVKQINPLSRWKCCVQLVLQWWPYIQPLIAQCRKSQESGNTEKAIDNPIKKLFVYAYPTSESYKGEDNKITDDGTFAFDPEARIDACNQIEQALYAIKCNPQGQTDDAGKIAGQESLEQVIKVIARTEAVQKAEQELAARLRLKARDILNAKDDKAVKNIKIDVNRTIAVPNECVAAYNEISGPLLAISRRLQSAIRQLLRDFMDGGKESNLFRGRRINIRGLAKPNNRRVFYKMHQPQDFDGMAVTLLLDLSGSMGGEKANAALYAGIILFDFCHALGIPIQITGHNFSDEKVLIQSFSEFESVDGNDRYRIMGLKVHSCNHDGAAIRYVARQLLLRPEPLKLLILISDGQPNAGGYSGKTAFEDLKNLKRKCERRGIKFIAAAIDEDKSVIEEIYGNSFLDITDLDRLPSRLAGIISDYIQNMIR